jgi:hypothetical protein
MKTKELKSKRMTIYFVGKSILVRPNKRTNGRYAQLKHDKEAGIGQALTWSSTDEEIGRIIREQYANCT